MTPPSGVWVCVITKLSRRCLEYVCYDDNDEILHVSYHHTHQSMHIRYHDVVNRPFEICEQSQCRHEEHVTSGGGIGTV